MIFWSFWSHTHSFASHLSDVFLAKKPMKINKWMIFKAYYKTIRLTLMVWQTPAVVDVSNRYTEAVQTWMPTSTGKTHDNDRSI